MHQIELGDLGSSHGPNLVKHNNVQSLIWILKFLNQSEQIPEKYRKLSNDWKFEIFI